jgi:hypothetical protein
MVKEYAGVSVILAACLCAQGPPGQPGLPAPGIHRSATAGLYEATTQVLVEASDQIRNENWPPCEGAANNMLADAARAFIKASNADPKLKIIATILVGPIMQKLDEFARKSGGDIGLFIAPNRKASCKPLAVALPVGSVVRGFRLFAGDGGRGFHQCLQDGNGHFVCNVDHVNGQIVAVPNGVAFCGWESVPPVTRISASNQVVGAVFKNWSHDRQRWASLTVLFRPPHAGINSKRLS